MRLDSNKTKESVEDRDASNSNGDEEKFETVCENADIYMILCMWRKEMTCKYQLMDKPSVIHW